MKAFFQVIAEFFQNMDGSGSSRRLVGIGLTVCGIVGGFLRLDTTFCLGLVTGGVALLGLTTVDDHAVKPVISTSGFMRYDNTEGLTGKPITATTNKEITESEKKNLGIPDNAG